MARAITLGFKNINNYYLQNKADMKDKQIQSFLLKWIYLRNLLRWVMGMTPAVWFSGIPVSKYKPCCAINNQSTDLTTQHMNNKINCAYFLFILDTNFLKIWTILIINLDKLTLNITIIIICLETVCVHPIINIFSNINY